MVELRRSEARLVMFVPLSVPEKSPSYLMASWYLPKLM